MYSILKEPAHLLKSVLGNMEAYMEGEKNLLFLVPEDRAKSNGWQLIGRQFSAHHKETTEPSSPEMGY